METLPQWSFRTCRSPSLARSLDCCLTRRSWCLDIQEADAATMSSPSGDVVAPATARIEIALPGGMHATVVREMDGSALAWMRTPEQ